MSSAKETLLSYATSLMEELSDEALTACVGGCGYFYQKDDKSDPVELSEASDGKLGYIQIGKDGKNTMKWVGKKDLNNPDKVWWDPNGSGRVLSDRNIKEQFSTVDVHEVLSKVAKLSIETWKYKDQPECHIGPMAQDFAAAFNVGDSDRHIHNVDAQGVALASIQALYKMLMEKDTQIDALRADLSCLQQVLKTSASSGN